MITQQLLQERDYRRYYTTYIKPNAQALWQKRVWSESGTRYFIDLYEYDLRLLNNTISYECDVQFKQADGAYLNISFSARDLDETEAKVEELFQTLGCMDYD